MISKADPTLLADLCATLLRENDAPPAPAPPKALPPTMAQARPVVGGVGQIKATGGRATPAGLRPLGHQSVNSAGVRRLGVGVRPRPSVNSTAVGMGVSAAAGVSSAAFRGGGVGVEVGEGGAGAGKGSRRRMCTPTKASVGGRVPERKTTRVVSPPKGNGVPAAAARPKELALSEGQQRAVDLVADGKSVFFTGNGGGWGTGGGRGREQGGMVGGCVLWRC